VSAYGLFLAKRTPRWGSWNAQSMETDREGVATDTPTMAHEPDDKERPWTSGSA
jgi:hypothetical protein